ncbi:unnamed protein product [Ceutorhynchus assimilis]|uniref:Structure-specific endonuclease subunit SLX4 n=1 Tax=Ceutorhynchus assimilis TaxID=467358 RepID=A0A9N9MJV2_9CUCU|nr:unnamed protein product [Ceutorhynchus assimilis]
MNYYRICRLFLNSLHIFSSSKSKTATSKKKQNQSVSKYFQSKKELKNDDSSQKSTPKKSDPKNKFNDSADDFRSPMPIAKNRNLTWKLNQPKQKTNKKSKSKAKNCTLEIIKDNFEGGDENPEHLQMAIALSKSSYEAEYGHNCELQNNVPDIGEILQNVKPTNLERFGFKKSKPTIAVECRNLQKPEVSRKGRGGLKYITPILDIRTPEERESIIESKITFISSQPNIAIKKPSKSLLTSLKLQEVKSENYTIFGLDNLYGKNCFYVEDLLLEKNQNKCGFLLKDWSLIPGRDKSPPKIPSHITENSDKRPLKMDLCIESLLEHRDLVIEVTNEKLSRSPKPFSTNLPPNNIRDGAKNISRSIYGSSITTSKDSGVSSSGQYSSFSTNRSISPDLFSSDDEYDYSASKNKIQATSPQVDNNNIEEDKNNLESLDLRLDDDDTPINRSNSSLRPAGFYSLDEFEDQMDEGGLSCGFKEPNSDEERVSSPKCIAKNTDIEYSTCSYDVGKNMSSPESMTDLSFTKNISIRSGSECYSPKSTVSNSHSEILQDSFHNIDTADTKSIAKNLPNFIDGGLSTFQRSMGDVQFNPSVNNFEELKKSSCSLSLNSISFPKSSSSDNENSIDSVDTSVDTASMGSILESDKSGNLVESDRYLGKLEFKETTLTLEDPETDCAISFHNHDDMVEVAAMPINDKTNTAPDFSPIVETLLPQQNHSFIEILDDSSSDLVYETKPSKSPFFDDYKFDPKKSPTNNSTPLTTTRLSSIRMSTAFNSAELNITDYVTQILNKEHHSFDNPKINEDMPSSQDFVDEELNYSCHCATPVRPAREVIFEEDMPKPEAPLSIIEAISTPNKYIIKTENITPMPNYDKMATPSINKELQKMGIKPLKRAKGSKLLKYIYESTHPLIGSVDLIEASDSESQGKIIKRRKRKQEVGVKNETALTDVYHNPSIEIVGDLLLQNEKPENLIFERKQSAKILSCRVPLQIVWHNFLSCNPTIKENILLYEPLHLESLHELLKEQGFKFHAQDLLTFLDKKCITIRTNQNRGKKHR